MGLIMAFTHHSLDMLRKLLDVCMIPAQAASRLLTHLREPVEGQHGAAAAGERPGALAQAWQQEQASALGLRIGARERAGSVKRLMNRKVHNKIAYNVYTTASKAATNEDAHLRHSSGEACLSCVSGKVTNKQI